MMQDLEQVTQVKYVSNSLSLTWDPTNRNSLKTKRHNSPKAERKLVHNKHSINITIINLAFCIYHVRIPSQKGRCVRNTGISLFSKYQLGFVSNFLLPQYFLEFLPWVFLRYNIMTRFPEGPVISPPSTLMFLSQSRKSLPHQCHS